MRDAFAGAESRLATLSSNVGGFIDWYIDTYEPNRRSYTDLATGSQVSVYCVSTTWSVVSSYLASLAASTRAFEDYCVTAKYYFEDPLCSSDRLTYESNLANNAYRLNKILVISPKQ